VASIRPGSRDETSIQAAQAGDPPGRQVHPPGRVADRDLYLYEGPSYPRPQYRREVDDLLAFHRRAFVGRGHELDELAKFAADPGGGYLLVEAAPGHGKSALLAELMWRWQARRWATRPLPVLLCFFIRAARDQHTPDAFATSVSAQLLDLLDLPGGVPPDLDAQRHQLASLWAKAAAAAQAEQPLLLVVDGLDEMANDDLTISDLLPAELGRHAGVIVSSRSSTSLAARVAVGHPLHRARIQRLQPFGRDEIGQLLRAQNSSLEGATAMAARIGALTGGEPLFTQLLCQEVTAADARTLDGLESAPPADVKDYARRQLRGLAMRIDGELAWDVLAVLMVARGSMTRDEMADVLGVSPTRVDRAIDPVRPFLSELGDRLEFAHRRLRAVVAEEFTPAERRESRRRLLGWCARFAHAGWPDDTPGYVLERYAARLAEARDGQALYALVSRRWMRLQVTRTGSHHALARDVRQAIRVACSERPANLVQEVRGSLVYATVASRAATAPAEVLGVLASVGGIAGARRYMARIADPAGRGQAYREIAAELLRHPEVAEARLGREQALASAQTTEVPWVEALLPAPALAAPEGGNEAAGALPPATPPDEDAAQAAKPHVMDGSLAVAGPMAGLLTGSTGNTWAVARVARALAQAGRVAEALGVAEAAPDPFKAWALAEVAGSLATAGRVAEARAIAGRARHAGAEALAMTDVAAALVKAGRVAEAVAALERIVAATRTMEDPLRAWTLARAAHVFAMAGRAEEARVAADEALVIARALQDAKVKAEVVARTGEALVAAGRVAEAVAVAKKLPGPWGTWALAEVAGALVAAGRVTEAVEVAKGLRAALVPVEGGWGVEPAVMPVELHVGSRPHTPAPVGRALGGARPLEGWEERARTLAAIAVALAVAGRSAEAAALAEQALAGASALREAQARAGLLAEVAAALAVVGRSGEAAALAERALAAARAIREARTGARAVGEVAAGLARSGRVAEALALVQRLEGEETEPRALAWVTGALVAAGRQDEAAAVAEQALDRVRALGSAQAGMVALAEVAGALAVAGRSGQADAVAEQALDRVRALGQDRVGARVLAEVAAGLARAGRLAEALEIAQRVEAAAARARALAEVAAALAVAGRKEEAATVAEQALACARTTSRSAVFQVVRHGLPVFDETGDGHALTLLGRALLEIEGWWVVGS
jgi:tetratricopeptide (TPR) repeat protein